MLSLCLLASLNRAIVKKTVDGISSLATVPVSLTSQRGEIDIHAPLFLTESLFRL